MKGSGAGGVERTPGKQEKDERHQSEVREFLTVQLVSRQICDGKLRCRGCETEESAKRHANVAARYVKLAQNGRARRAIIEQQQRDVEIARDRQALQRARFEGSLWQKCEAVGAEVD